MGCDVIIDKNTCKGCGICVTMCTKKVLKLSDELGPKGYRYPVLIGECIGCKVCELFCPDFSIIVICSSGGGGIEEAAIDR
jgi:2-oxoglutarate ferredoxin oxidoreductase subunit delta